MSIKGISRRIRLNYDLVSLQLKAGKCITVAHDLGLKNVSLIM